MIRHLFCVLAAVRMNSSITVQQYEHLGCLTIRDSESVRDNSEELRVWHSMSGNPGIQSKSMEFRSDDEWRSNMPLISKLVCYAFTLPVSILISLISMKSR